MPAPELTFSVTGTTVSGVSGYNAISVTFSSDVEYIAFECRATRADAEWGLGIGTLVAAFSQTPANVNRTFEVYDTFLTSGDGTYRITLYAQGTGGNWNDKTYYYTLGTWQLGVNPFGAQV